MCWLWQPGKGSSMTEQKIPVEYYQLAEENSLGQPIALHRTDFRDNFTLVPSVMAVTLVIIAVSLPFILWRNDVDLEDWLMVSAWVIGFFMLLEVVWAFILLVPRFSTRKYQLCVCTEGVLY